MSTYPSTPRTMTLDDILRTLDQDQLIRQVRSLEPPTGFTRAQEEILENRGINWYSIPFPDEIIRRLEQGRTPSQIVREVPVEVLTPTTVHYLTYLWPFLEDEIRERLGTPSEATYETMIRNRVALGESLEQILRGIPEGTLSPEAINRLRSQPLIVTSIQSRGTGPIVGLQSQPLVGGGLVTPPGVGTSIQTRGASGPIVGLQSQPLTGGGLVTPPRPSVGGTSTQTRGTGPIVGLQSQPLTGGGLVTPPRPSIEEQFRELGGTVTLMQNINPDAPHMYSAVVPGGVGITGSTAEEAMTGAIQMFIASGSRPETINRLQPLTGGGTGTSIQVRGTGPIIGLQSQPLTRPSIEEQFRELGGTIAGPIQTAGQPPVYSAYIRGARGGIGAGAMGSTEEEAMTRAIHQNSRSRPVFSLEQEQMREELTRGSPSIGTQVPPVRRRLEFTEEAEPTPLHVQSYEVLMRQLYGQPVILPEFLVINRLRAPFVSYQEAQRMLNQGEVRNYTIEPLVQPWAGPPGTPNRIINLITNDGRLFLVKARYYEQKIYPPQ